MVESRSTGPVVVRIRCGAELAELAADALWQSGTTAVAEEPAGTDPGISDPTGTDGGLGTVELTGEVPHGALEALRSWCRDAVGHAEVEVLAVDPAWADAWCEHARAVRVGPLVIRPVWVTERIGAHEIDVPLDPGPTFGSGSHPSTRGVLGAIVERVTGGESVLDVGSGSGVLSVAALLLGATSAVGVDTDPAAAQAGRSAAELCGVPHDFEFRHGGLDVVEGSFDLVLANMLIGAIESLGAGIRARCRAAGSMVLGGFLESQRDRALAAVQPAQLVSESVDEGWVTLVARPVR